MLYHWILCRSMTHAQRTSQILDRGGIPNRILRAPPSLSGEGCSHSVRLPEGYLDRALPLLERARMSPKRVVQLGENGGEVEE